MSSMRWHHGQQPGDAAPYYHEPMLLLRVAGGAVHAPRLCLAAAAHHHLFDVRAVDDLR
jgi:hypothetical protein